MAKQDRAPGGIDTTTPNVARIYDYLLSGKDNFAADREAAKRLIAAIPDFAEIARDNRSFLGRVVRYLAIKGGIRQFLDLGSGLPTQANVHELAQGVAPDARVVYVDNDPVVASHGRALRGLRARRASPGSPNGGPSRGPRPSGDSIPCAAASAASPSRRTRGGCGLR